MQSCKLKYSGINPETYDPPQNIDIVWHDEKTCTIYYEKKEDLEKVKNDLSRS
jgi:hypothetical protein